MLKKPLIKSLFSEEKEILRAAHDCNFYSLHKTDKIKAFTVLFEKLTILKKMSTKKLLEKLKKILGSFSLKKVTQV